MHQKHIVAALLLMLYATSARAESISYAGGAYSQDFGTYAQDFNTLPSSTTNTILVTTSDVGPVLLPVSPISATGMPGWSFARSFGPSSRFNVSDGSLSSSGVFSFGSFGSSERALGSLASDTSVFYFGAEFVNDSSATLTEFTLSFTGEQWRDGFVATGAANTLAFSYAVDALNISNGTFTSVAALNFVAPKHAASGSDVALNGNLPENQRALSATITGINWQPGAKLVLRWTDVNDGGNDDGLAIDNLSFSARGAVGSAGGATAVPLPSVAVAALPLLMALVLRRAPRRQLH
jgi:hypothetical protein